MTPISFALCAMVPVSAIFAAALIKTECRVVAAIGFTVIVTVATLAISQLVAGGVSAVVMLVSV